MREAHQPVSRRSGVIPGRRLALALAPAVACGTLALSASAALADIPLVSATIYSSAGTTQDSVSLGTLEGNPGNCPAYIGPAIEQHGRQGTVTENFSPATWTVSTILACLQPTPVAAKDVTAITIVGANGAPETSANSQLMPNDLTSPSDFFSTAENPVVTSLGSTIEYDRPWRGGSDNNFGDQVQEPAGTPIVIEVFEGPRLAVTASASSTSISPGGTVSFHAIVSPSDPSDQFHWNFDGVPGPTTVASPRVTFTQAGLYNVTVQVTDAAGGGGGDTIAITVGQPTQTNSTTPTNTTTSGPANPTPQPHQKHNPTSGGPGGNSFGGSGGGRHDNGSNGQGNTQPASHGTQTTPAATTPSTSGSGSGGSGSGGSGAGATSGSSGASNTGANTNTRGHAGGAPLRSPIQSQPRTSTGGSRELVTGRLVSDVIPIPADASPLVHLTPATVARVPAPRPPSGSSFLPGVGGALAIFLLLSLGAARELRSRRDWRALRFGS